MKILLDECVPARLGRLLTDHSVITVSRRGWAGIKNGDLLTLAEKEFDAFITVDRKLSVQQDLTRFKIAVVLIHAGTNRLEEIRPLVSELLQKLPEAKASMLTVVELAPALLSNGFLRPAQRVIIREIQRLHARRAPLNISAVKRSHPKLIKQVYAVRPFWGWKRALEDAGLNYKKINVELRDYVGCKICGRDFGGLAYHLINDHNVTPEDYREEYPEAEIVCETVRAVISQSKLRKRSPLPRWEPIWTPEYVLDRMAALHRLNFPLNFYWTSNHEQPLAG